MANPEHLETLRTGVFPWNGWRQSHPDIQPDLSGADLSGESLRFVNLARANLRNAKLRRVDLRSAILTDADLEGADLQRAYLRGASLERANLSGANIRGTDFNRAKLIGANLRDTVLLGPNFRGANLHDADLTHAVLYEVIFGNTDLSQAELEFCRHQGRSTIDLRTIERSKRSFPGSFLAGCGLPDSFIAYLPSLLELAVQYYSCFISYSTKDQEFADRLYADLQAKGVRCWFAEHDIRGGLKIRDQIDDAIRLHDKLLLILSESSMASDWVQEELARARRREVKEGKRMLFPVRLVPFEALEEWKCFDADSKKDSAREIREYFIPDFSNWKDHDSYQKAFTRLVADLKAESR